MASTWRPTSIRTRLRRLLLLLVAPRDAERLEAFQRELGVDHHAGRRCSAYAAGSPAACRSRASPGRCRRPWAGRPGRWSPCASGRTRRAPACWRGSPASETMLVERSVRFFCAVSITASRSFSLAIDSCVLREVSLRSVPTRCVMRSSRSLTARAMSPWRATLISAKLCKRPFELGELGGLRLGLAPPPAHMHDQRDGEREQRQDRKPRQRQHDEDRVERDGADLNGLHGPSAERIARFVRQTKTGTY